MVGILVCLPGISRPEIRTSPIRSGYDSGKKAAIIVMAIPQFYGVKVGRIILDTIVN